MLIRSVSGLLALDLGFEPRGLVAVDLFAASEDFAEADRIQAFRTLLERVEGLPGVEGAAWVNRLPVRDDGWQGPVSIAGNPDLQGADAPNALYRRVSPGYFRVLGIGLESGRFIEEGDRAGTEHVTVVNRAFAERAWPGQSALGRRVRSGVAGDTLTVVGVVEEVRSTAVVGANPFVLYVADEQAGDIPFKVLVIRAQSPAAPLLASVRRLAAEVDPRLATYRPTTLPEVVTAALAEPLQLRFFLSLFAGLALALGLVGVYSVASYSVARRQTELGLRMALGASPRQVLRQIMREGIVPVAAGTALGLVAAMILARLATRFLYGVSPQDPLSMSGAALALLAAGMVAALLPALRASRVSPVESLRAE
ncbi:MAG: FtsX-like permease family protein [Gemmatimonadales bacterium]